MTKEQILAWLYRQRWGLVWFWGTVIAVGAGILVWQMRDYTQPKVEIIQVGQREEPGGETKWVWVDMSGQVQQPGVYKLVAGSRVEQAIEATGGIAQGADLVWVERNLNKAAKVVDGQKIYIPRAGEQESVRVEVGKSVDKKISLNNSGQAELESLPGVGPVTAKKIIAGRPFQDAGELVARKILSQKVYEQIKDSVELW